MLVSMSQQSLNKVLTSASSCTGFDCHTPSKQHLHVLNGSTDLDSVMPTHVEDLLAIPEQLATGPLRIAVMHA